MTWIVIVEFLARVILLVLFILSIWSIAIIIDRFKFFKALTEESGMKKLLDSFNKELETTSDNKIDFLFSAKRNQLINSWNKGLSVLGTLGSTSPFIGLLGTILGIIVSFGELSKGSSDMNQVMFALAEALILTAVGLFVAIPAVIAFNYFNKKMKSILITLEIEKDLYLAKK